MTEVEFWEYKLIPRNDTPFLLSIGERVKKGTIRPTVTTIPFSTIVGALKATSNLTEVYAAGFLEDKPEPVRIDHSATDWATGAGKLPLSTYLLVNPAGKVYVLVRDDKIDIRNALKEQMDITLGALKSKGFGRCQLKKSNNTIINPERKTGELKTRIPLECAERFGIDTVIKPVYGYLYRPLSLDKAICVKALFEGSTLQAFHFLLKESRNEYR